MKRYFILICLLLAYGVKAQELTDKLPTDQSVISGVLPNGIRYYVKKNSKPENRAELRLAVNAGSTSEDDDQQGLAHFVEHMAFNGSKSFKKNELVDYLESLGIKFGPHLNAYTSFDETVYMIQIPTDEQTVMDKGIQILTDWANGLSFDSLEIEKERGVVVEEWRLGQGANERMRRQYWPLLFKDSRYAVRLPIGKKEIIENSPHAALKRFYHDWYRPDLMAVVVVGDFDPQKMAEKIKTAFSGMKGPEKERPVQAYSVPGNDNIIIATATDKEARFANVDIVYKEKGKHDETVEDYRKSLARQLFSAMMNARTAELTREADPPFIQASSGYGRWLRNLYVYSNSGFCKEDGIARTLTTLATENERVRRFGFTQSELDRQKAELLRGYEKSYNERDKTESASYAREYVSNYLRQEPYPGISYEYDIAKKYVPGITLKEVNDFAQEWITEGKDCIVLITAPDKESTKMPTDDEIKSILKSARTMELKPYVDKTSDEPLLSAKLTDKTIVSESTIKEMNITEWKLPNGVRVVFKPTDFKNDEVLFSSFSWGGWSLYPAGEFMSAAQADEIIDESGIGDFDVISLTKKLSGKLVGCTPYISELQQGLNGSCSPADLETLMQLIYLYQTSPRMDEQAFTSWKEKKKGILRNRSLDPSSVFSDTMAYVMSGYDSRFRPMTPERLDEVDLKRVFEIYHDRFDNAQATTFFFVGNFNVDTLRKYTVRYLANLPSTADSTGFKDIGVRPPKGQVTRTVNLGQEPKSSVVMRWNQPFEYNRNNRNEINALNKLINIRLREVLREEKSGVYGVRFGSSPQHYPYQELENSIRFGCSPDNVQMLVDAALDVIKEVKSAPCDEKNLVKIKETAIRERETYLKENRFWLNVMSSSYENKEDILTLNEFDEWVKNLTADDLLKAAKKYLQEDNYAKFVLMPASSSGGGKSGGE